MLQRRYAGQLDERADRYIDFAVDGAQRMQDLINDLLAFSRVGRMTRRTSRSRLQRARRARATTRLATLIEETGAEIVVDGELPTVQRRPRRCSRLVFQNLIGNAIKFRGDDAAAGRDRRRARRRALALPVHRQRHRRSTTSTPSGSSSSSSACTRARPTRARASASPCAARSSSTTAGGSGSRRRRPAAGRASCFTLPADDPKRRARA